MKKNEYFFSPVRRAREPAFKIGACQKLEVAAFKIDACN
jgi:hypothetical protein